MTYMGKPYYPWWLDNLADDVTGEGAFMEGAAQGAEAVRSIVTYARSVYEDQEFSFTGDYGDNGYLEEYTTQVRGHPTRVVVTVARNAAGKAQHIVVNHRPRSSVLLVARLCGEHFADTPLARLFITNES
jgi:phosphatidate phosphatase APP1